MSTKLNEKIQDLINNINDLVDTETDHITDGDWYGSDYLESYRYGQSSLHALIKESGLEDTDDLLRYPETDLASYIRIGVTGIYVSANELDSLSVGEVEIELPEAIQPALIALSDDEFEVVRRHTNAYISDRRTFVYLDMSYTRYVMTFDVDDFYADHERPEASDPGMTRLIPALARITALDSERKKIKTPSLRVIEGKGLDPVDFMIYRRGRRFMSPKSKASLKLVK